MDLGLEGRTAVVAGASAGLGYACAAALAKEGARVVIGSRSADRIEAAAERLGHGAVPLVVDLDSRAAGVDFVERATRELGSGPDVLVLNTGGPPAGNFETTEPEAYLPALRQNLLSAVGMCNTAVPAMRSRGWGRIIAITSIAVKQPIPNLILSNTARAGLTGFLKTLASEVAPHGITVNSVLPGAHATDRLFRNSGNRTAYPEIPVGRPGTPEHFGAVVAFLASGFADFVTGAAVPIDGGASRGLL